jgi:hypothetical protein
VWVMLGCWSTAPTTLSAALLLSSMLPCELACAADSVVGSFLGGAYCIVVGSLVALATLLWCRGRA